MASASRSPSRCRCCPRWRTCRWPRWPLCPAAAWCTPNTATSDSWLARKDKMCRYCEYYVFPTRLNYLFVYTYILLLQQLVDDLRRLFDKYMDKVFKFAKRNCSELVPVAELNAVQSLCRLFDCLANAENGVDLKNDADGLSRAVELWFQFWMIWSLLGSLDEEGRTKIDAYLREMEGSFPNKDTIYEYYVDPKTKSWTHWEERLPRTRR